MGDLRSRRKTPERRSPLVLTSSSILVMLALAGPTIILFGGRVRDRTSQGKSGGFL